jgi:hypothetical protein
MPGRLDVSGREEGGIDAHRHRSVGVTKSPCERPRRVVPAIVVVALATVSGPLATELNGLPSTPMKARAVSDETTARHLIKTGQTSAALIVDLSGKTDTLLVASGGGPAVVTALEAVTTDVEARQHRTATVQDIVPLQPGDGCGLTGSYLVVSWLVGGYLVASAFWVAKEARPANARRTTIRLLALLPYAVLSGLGGAIIVDQALDALTGHFLALALRGRFLVYAAGRSRSLCRSSSTSSVFGSRCCCSWCSATPAPAAPTKRRCCPLSGGPSAALSLTGPASTPCATSSISAPTPLPARYSSLPPTPSVAASSPSPRRPAAKPRPRVTLIADLSRPPSPARSTYPPAVTDLPPIPPAARA